ncbi:Mce family protein [Gordonia araii NBRC 100433]|uniref:Mce family protein n=1 Tax=Gordonia araii NBRC 100433 TaxID=1073574 RepID=G7GXB5_9ACTN|nr:MlaD family protein [Gordonia araii]NNG99013.1 MCE family protein [Gordonia araii NBRC 100433]GAB08240.1 Mce family protein [Gordonia araii NBRC 100433]
MKLPAPVTLLLLAIITALGSVYMAFGVLGYNPAKSSSTLTVLMPSSGGLMNTSLVSLRGAHVGKVLSIAEAEDGLRVRVTVDASAKIPVDSTVRVANLSAAGEQYMDFQPAALNPPFLADGAVVPASQVKPGTTVGEALAKLDAFTNAISADSLNTLITTMRGGFAGREQDFEKVIRATSMFGQLLTDKAAELRQLYRNLQTLGDRFAGYGPLVSRAAGAIGAAIPDVLFIVAQFERYSHVGEKVWKDPIGPLIDKLTGYCAKLCPDFALIASILGPYTKLVRPIRVDITELLRAAKMVFPGDGTAHVAVMRPPR